MEIVKTDIIIISYNTLHHTLKCIRSIYETSNDLIANLIVVDNASIDGTVEAIKEEFPEILVIVNQENLGYAKAVNIGFRASTSDFIILSNSDVIYQDNSIKNLINFLYDNNGVGAVGPLQLYPDGSYQYCYGDLPGFKLGLKKIFLLNHLKDYYDKLKWKKGNLSIKQVPYLDGAVLASSRKAFEDVGGFDEDYFFYTEEADFCYKLHQKNWQIIHNPKSVITHFRGATDGSSGLNKNRLSMMLSSKSKFCKKHLSFQSGKFYIISEIIYSLNMTILWYVFDILFRVFKPDGSILTIHNSQFTIDKSKLKKNRGEQVTDNGESKLTTPNLQLPTKRKIEYNKLLFHLWLEEFNKFLRSNDV